MGICWVYFYFYFLIWVFDSDGIFVGSGGMVVTGLFGCFLNGFVAAYLLGLWWVWGHSGYCVVVTRLFGCFINGLWLGIY